MAALGHERYGVMGWSDGAISAVMLAAEKSAHVERLVIFGGNAYLTAEDIEAFEDTRDVEASWSKRMKETHIPTYGDDLQRMWGSAVDAWAGLFKAQDGNLCMAEARAIACPTLVLHGAKDPICLGEHPRWFRENIPDSQLIVLPEGKHNLHLRYADEVNGLVRRFMRGERVGE